MQQTPLCSTFNLQLDESQVLDAALAPLGGPLAVLLKDKICIFTGAGKLLKEWPFAICFEDGCVWIMDFYFTPPRRIRGFDVPVNLALVYAGGIVAISTSLKLFHLTVDGQVELNELCNRLPFMTIPRTMTVFPNEEEVLIGLVEQPGCLSIIKQQAIKPYIPSNFQASPSLVLLAHPWKKNILVSYCTDDRIIVVTRDFSQLLYSRDVKLELSPDVSIRVPRVDFCTENFICLTWPKTPWSIQRRRQTQGCGVLMFSIEDKENLTRFALQSEFFATAMEIDGVRIMGITECHLLKPTNAVLNQLLVPGSTTPGALLVEALVALDNRDSMAHVLLEDIQDKQQEAFNELIQASIEELNHSKRQTWLRAASLISPVDASNAFALTQAVENSRASFTISSLRLGVTTVKHIYATSRETCLSRMIKSSGDFNTCMQLANWFKLSPKPCVALWARVVAQQRGDFDLIKSRLCGGAKNKGNLSGAAASCAVAAWNAGRKELGMKLVGLEVKLSRKVVGLLAMQEPMKALELLDSCSGVDPDLVLRVGVIAKVDNHPAVMRMYKGLGHFAHLERLLANQGSKQALYQRAMLLIEGVITRQESFHEKRQAILEDAAKEFEVCGRPDRALQTKEYAKLLLLQENISPKMVGRSVCESIVDCVARRQEDLVDKFKQGVSPMLYWQARLRGLGMRAAWPEAQKLAVNKESNKYVNFVDVADMCIEHGALSFAAQVAFDMPMDDARSFVLIKLKMFKEALQAAKSLETLSLIMAQCVDAGILDATKLKIAQVKQEMELNQQQPSIPGLETLRGVVGTPRRCDTQ